VKYSWNFPLGPRPDQEVNGDLEKSVYRFLNSEAPMDRPKIDALAERIERLERENRRWRWGSGLAMIAGLVVMFGGAQRANDAKVVEAEQFIVRDKDGNERVRVGVGSNGAAHLVLQNKDRKGGIDLVSSSEGDSYFDVWNKTMGHLMLVAAPDRTAVDFLDTKRVGQIALKIEKGDGTQYLSFLKEGKGSLSLGLHEDGSGGLGVTDFSSRRRMELWQSSGGGPVLRVFDADGKSVAQIPTR
jgi:hypothetical protein